MKRGIAGALICTVAALGLLACDDAKKLNTGPLLTSITVTPANLSIPVDASQYFTATGAYSDNTIQNITSSVTWTSSDTSRANITNTGMATAITAGTSTIKATLGVIAGTTTLTITPQTATLISIAVTPSDPGISAGEIQQFTATGTYSDSTTQNITGSVTWSSSNTSDATISITGLATGVAAGTTSITAASGSISGTTTLSVTGGGAVVPPNAVYSISGTIAYSGTAGGTTYVCAALYADPPLSGCVTRVIAQPGGSFIIPNLPERTYYIEAFVDVDGDSVVDWNMEPIGIYKADVYSDTASALSVNFNAGNLTGIDFTILDNPVMPLPPEPASLPTPTFDFTPPPPPSPA